MNKEYAVVKKYDFNEVDIYKKEKILEDFTKKYLHSCVYRCFYDKNYTNFTNNEEVVLTFSLGYIEFIIGYIEFESDYYGLDKKIENVRKNCLIFVHLNKLRIKNSSNL